VVAAAGDRATAFVVLGSIVIPLAVLSALCWFFWKHRRDE
jgi:hypothetical protein